MVENLEREKEAVKARLIEEVEEYFEKFEKSSKEAGFDINKIEALMIEQNRKIKEVLLKSNSELTSNVGIEAKKKCPECGKEVERVKKGEKLVIKTKMGELEIKRDYYYCRSCKHKEIPLDEALGLKELPYKMTRELMLEVGYYCQNQSSFSEGSAMLKRALEIEVNKETAREITEKIGSEVHAADTKKAKYLVNNMHMLEMEPEAAKGGKRLYIMPDGAAVNTRVEDENGSTWREVKSVIAFTDKDIIKRKDGGSIIVNKECASFIGSAEDFRGYVLNVAVNAGYGKVREVVVIADGAAWIRNMCNELFPEATQILDLYHLKENIYTYAKHKFSHDESEYVPWAEGFIDKIEKGKAKEALELLPTEEDLPQGVPNLRSYICNNSDKINYPEYKEKGYFVGSGAIESANKVLVQRRLKQPGMRWSVYGAQALLSLRAKVVSNLWLKDVRSLLLA